MTKIYYSDSVLETGKDVFAVYIDIAYKVSALDYEELFISSESVVYDIQKNNPTKIRLALFKLSDLGLIRFVEDARDGFIAKKKDFAKPHGCSITGQEYCAITSVADPDIIIDLLYHFCYIVRSFDLKVEINERFGVVGHMSSAYFVKREQCEYSDVYNNNRRLTKLGLIVWYDGPFNKEYNANIKYYSRPEDKIWVEEYVTKAFNAFDYAISDEKKAILDRFYDYANDLTSLDETHAFKLLMDIFDNWEFFMYDGMENELNTVFTRKNLIDGARLTQLINVNNRRCKNKNKKDFVFVIDQIIHEEDIPKE